MKKLIALLGIILFVSGCSNNCAPAASCDPCGYSSSGPVRTNWNN